MLKKLEKAFKEAKPLGRFQLSFDSSELSLLIALVKYDRVYEKTLSSNMEYMFSKGLEE